MTVLGVLVMAYGGPNSLDEVEPYLQDVRGRRPTPPEVVAEIKERYRAIGGSSPLLPHTLAQTAALQQALDRLVHTDDVAFKTFVGMRHWHPYIREALAQMSAEGIRRAIGLVMAPHYSAMSVGAYFRKVEEAGFPVEVAPIESWHLLDSYLQTLALRVQDGLARFPVRERAGIPVLFTAHSLPARILENGDPYRDQLLQTVAGVIALLGPQPHEFAFQSAGRTAEPWLGPDAGEVIRRLAEEGYRNVLVAPIGFLVEHVEVLYDVDIEYRRLAESLGMHLERIQLVDAAPEMMSGLARLVAQRAREKGWLRSGES